MGIAGYMVSRCEYACSHMNRECWSIHSSRMVDVTYFGGGDGFQCDCLCDEAQRAVETDLHAASDHRKIGFMCENSWQEE